MAQQRKHPRAAPTAVGLRSRVERALREGRSQQALDLAKTLFRQEPTPKHHALVRQAYLARGRELRERGATRDSLIVLKAAVQSQGDDPAWLAAVAEQLALSGGVQEMLALLPRLADPALQDRLLGHAVDSALSMGNAGRSILPESYHADFDRIVQAFALSESRQDEEARTVLGGIGLRSPFVEWKLLVRGLLAYYNGDDSRALENWQRLNTERLPSRLAAPFRQVLDAPFRAAQPAATQTLLQQQFDRLQGSPLAAQLRSLRSALADKRNLAPAFRQAETLVPELRRVAPAMAERLSRVFYWAITETRPDDVARYQRVFGRPANDPEFNRLQALAQERCLNFAGASKSWQKYEKDIADNPSWRPEGQADRARALIWIHVGRAAAMMPHRSELPELPPFLGDFPPMRRPLKPSADECFEHAIQLARDALEPYEALLDYHCSRRNNAKAVAAARRLLQQFPDHVPTLEALGDLCLDQDEQIEALAVYKRALHGNPLDRRLRTKTALAHAGSARLFAVRKDFEQARQELQAAIALHGGTAELVYLCRGAAIELKAGNPSGGEEWLARARQQAGSDLIVAYRMLTETARLKLPKAAKTRFENEFSTALEAPPSGAAAADLARTTASLDDAAPYLGQKTHQKRVLAYLDSAKKSSFTEIELQDTCSSLLRLDAIRLARQYLGRGRKKFPKSPHFPYMQAMTYFQQIGAEGVPPWKVRPLLKKAERLARALPATDQLKAMLDDIGERLKALDAYDFFGPGTIADPFGMPFDDAEETFGDDYKD